MLWSIAPIGSSTPLNASIAYEKKENLTSPQEPEFLSKSRFAITHVIPILYELTFSQRWDPKHSTQLFFELLGKFDPWITFGFKAQWWSNTGVNTTTFFFSNCRSKTQFNKLSRIARTVSQFGCSCECCGVGSAQRHVF